jgi:hypothetical protein
MGFGVDGDVVSQREMVELRDVRMDKRGNRPFGKL